MIIPLELSPGTKTHEMLHNIHKGALGFGVCGVKGEGGGNI